jgi:hypothetical protein
LADGVAVSTGSPPLGIIAFSDTVEDYNFRLKFAIGYFFLKENEQTMNIRVSPSK